MMIINHFAGMLVVFLIELNDLKWEYLPTLFHFLRSGFICYLLLVICSANILHFSSCFPLELRCQLVPTSVKCDNLPVTSESQPKIRRSIRFSSCRKRSNKIKAVATPTSISMFDLIGTPLESLPDLQSLEDFKKYLKTLYGLDSIQYCSLQLWTELILHYKLPKAKQHRQYRKIFNRFLSTSARV
jgi:hypothetical protein